MHAAVRQIRATNLKLNTNREWRTEKRELLSYCLAVGMSCVSRFSPLRV